MYTFRLLETFGWPSGLMRARGLRRSAMQRCLLISTLSIIVHRLHSLKTVKRFPYCPADEIPPISCINIEHLCQYMSIPMSSGSPKYSGTSIPILSMPPGFPKKKGNKVSFRSTHLQPLKPAPQAPPQSPPNTSPPGASAPQAPSTPAGSPRALLLAQPPPYSSSAGSPAWTRRPPAGRGCSCPDNRSRS